LWEHHILDAFSFHGIERQHNLGPKIEEYHNYLFSNTLMIFFPVHKNVCEASFEHRACYFCAAVADSYSRNVLSIPMLVATSDRKGCKLSQKGFHTAD
jgi:hypothetical protein